MKFLIKYTNDGKTKYEIIDSISSWKAEEKFEKSYSNRGSKIIETFRLLRIIRILRASGEGKIYTTTVELKDGEFLDRQRILELSGVEPAGSISYETIGYRVTKDRWDDKGKIIYIENASQPKD